jgi:hypothetical protein
VGQNTWCSGGCASTQSLRKIFVYFYVFVTSVARGTDVRTVFWCGNLSGRRRLGRPRQKWEDNTKTDFQKVGKGRMALIDLALDRLDACSCECGNELSGFIKLGNFLTS